MKKNKFMRLASILLVACLMSTCCISGTFAKYTTQDSASDSARVAKWGVELQAVGNLFGDSYIETLVKDDNTSVAVRAADYASNASDVVAPGTSNTEGFKFSLNGTPEVAGEITSTMKIQNVFLAAGSYGLMMPVASGVVTETNFDEFTGLYYKDGDNYTLATAWASGASYYTLEDDVTVANKYYPVVYSLAGGTATTGTSIAADSLKAAADAIALKLGLTAGEAATDTSITYTGTNPVTFAPNTNLNTLLALGGETLTWAWAFEQGDDDTAKAANNGADTILGLLENTTSGAVVKKDGNNYKALTEYTDYCLDTMFEINITVAQTDTYTPPTP